MSDTLKPRESHGSLGEIDFLGYISSLAFQAMIFLGEMESPLTGKVEKNIPQAKLLIDTLILLRDKTKGNLNESENHFLESSIYELQMKYVTYANDTSKNG